MPKGVYKRIKGISCGLPGQGFQKGRIVSPSCRNAISKALMNNKNADIEVLRCNKHAWKGGLLARKKQDIRNDSAYKGWVDEVKKRDKGICKFLNENCSGYLIVHHILSWSQYPEERYNINNGITLCQYHHPKRRVDEQKLIPVLRELVEIK